ncbi:MAG TPA: hypothetical protein VFZ58_01460 [Candidatus Saccharimonadales bacterium]
MRTELVVDLADGKKGYATLRGGWQDTLIIYLPCYGGNVRLDALPDRAGLYFEAMGITFLALNLYDSWLERARNLSDKLTLEDHVSDARAAIRLARKSGARNIHVVAHSLAAYPALMMALAQDKALLPKSIVLWDGSEPIPTLSAEGLRYDPARDLYIGERGSGFVVSKQYLDAVKVFRIEDIARGLATPILAIEAGNNETLRGVSEKYRTHLGEKWVKTQVIPRCGHHFIEDDEGCELLFERTFRWIKAGHLRVG